MTKKLFLLIAFSFSLLLFVSCGKDDEGDVHLMKLSKTLYNISASTDSIIIEPQNITDPDIPEVNIMQGNDTTVVMNTLYYVDVRNVGQILFYHDSIYHKDFKIEKCTVSPKQFKVTFSANNSKLKRIFDITVDGFNYCPEKVRVIQEAKSE